MALGTLVLVGLRASFVLALALLLSLGARRASASLRRCLLLLGVSAALAVPLLALPLPGRAMVHLSAPMVAAHVVAEALSPQAARVPPPVSPSRALAAPASRVGTSGWLFLAWALGASWVAARAIVLGIRARSLAARSQAAGQLLISAAVESPVVVGAWRPVIVLPSASQHWGAERLRAVLLHESAHVRRRDGLALLLAQCATALYWFQPLVWLVALRLRRECELAADEDVVAAGMRATTYADHLLAIARGLVIPAHGIAMAARPSELARRIQALVQRERLPAPLTSGRAALLGFGALLVLALVACTDAVLPSAHSAAVATLPAPTVGKDPALQSIADDEAGKLRAEWGARRVAIVVLDAHSSALLASHDDAPGQPIVPASTLKPLIVAVALDAGLITTEQRFDCGNGQRAYGADVLRDAGAYGELDAAQILAVSSNIGVSRIFDAVGGERLRAGLQRFHVELPSGLPSGSLRGAILAMGEGSTTTPLALASAYGVLANDGSYAGNAASPERVVKESTALALRNMLEGVVTGERATGTAARVAGVRVGGKTGTSDDDPGCKECAHGAGVFASFVGIVPLDQPRWVIYVGVEQPNREGSGGTVAAPAFARIATRALAL